MVPITERSSILLLNDFWRVGNTTGNRRHAHAEEGLVSGLGKICNIYILIQYISDHLVRIVRKLARCIGSIFFRPPHTGGVNIDITDTVVADVFIKVVLEPCRTSSLCDFMAVPVDKVNTPLDFIPELAENTHHLKHRAVAGRIARHTGAPCIKMRTDKQKLLGLFRSAQNTHRLRQSLPLALRLHIHMQHYLFPRETELLEVLAILSCNADANNLRNFPKTLRRRISPNCFKSSIANQLVLRSAPVHANHRCSVVLASKHCLFRCSRCIRNFHKNSFSGYIFPDIVLFSTRSKVNHFIVRSANRSRFDVTAGDAADLLLNRRNNLHF